MDGTHVLLVIGDEQRCAKATEYLSDHDARVHPAHNQFDAMGMLVELARRDIVPRAAIVDWLLHPMSSQEYAFYQMIRRPASATALHLVQNLRTVDDSIPIIVCADTSSRHRPSADLVTSFNLAIVEPASLFDVAALRPLIRPSHTPPAPLGYHRASTRVLDVRHRVLEEETARLNEAALA